MNVTFTYLFKLAALTRQSERADISLKHDINILINNLLLNKVLLKMLTFHELFV